MVAAIKLSQKHYENLGLREKKTKCYIERNEQERADYQEEIAKIPVSRRIYIDESGIDQFCYRSHARTPIGKRIHGFIPGRRYARTNVVAGYCNGKILGDYCYSGTTTSRVFEDWFCNILLPLIRLNDVIVIDNASFHNKKRLRKYACIWKVTIIFLPPYSPDFNPIENVWANMKRFLRETRKQFSSLQYGIYWYFCVRYS